MKKQLQTCAAFFAALILFVSCVSTGGAAECEGIIVNETGEMLVSVFAAPAGTDFWRPLFGENLENGETRAFKIERVYTAYWDIRAQGESGAEYTVRSIAFPAESTVFLTRDDLDTESFEAFDE